MSEPHDETHNAADEDDSEHVDDGEPHRCLKRKVVI